MTSQSASLVQRVCIYVILLIGALVFIAPFAWMVSTSLKPLNETMSMPPRWLPSEVQWENYPQAIDEMKLFWRYTANTTFLCIITVIGTVLSSSLAAYGFSRIEWHGRDKVFVLVLATMMIPFPVIMVPLYTLFRRLLLR
ncbi:MAG: carbohydrate ABC transporter permease [Puniceicoccales bacterium]